MKLYLIRNHTLTKSSSKALLILQKPKPDGGFFRLCSDSGSNDGVGELTISWEFNPPYVHV